MWWWMAIGWTLDSASVRHTFRLPVVPSALRIVSRADNGFRWTNGDAAVPIALFAGFTGSTELVLDIGATARYLAVDAVQHAA